jgi:hypothetical protein
MDPDTIEYHIKHLGKRDFDAVARMILVEFFGLTAIDVDGAGDGGADMLPFADCFSNRIWASLAIQMTVQEKQLEKKVLGDASKAKTQLGAQRFFFLTARAHQSTTLRNLENIISSRYNMSATCLGAKEIAGTIVERKLLRQFAEAIGLQMNVSVSNRPDRGEILLHAYVALSADRLDLKNEVYDDSILIALHEAGVAMSRSNVVLKAAEFLGVGAGTQFRLASRIDSLLARRHIHAAGAGLVSLSDDMKLQLQTADGIYVKELNLLAYAQSQILKDICNIDWNDSQCEIAASLLARWFVQRQLMTAEHTSVALANTGLSRTLGDPNSDLKQLLLEAGVPPRHMSNVFDQLVNVAAGTSLIKKLTKALTFVATEGQDPLKASRVLGASHWGEVITTLDASVAIPYLCASLFSPTLGRFSSGANECIGLLKGQGTPLVIPRVYVNEVAAHLHRAMRYPEATEFDASLEYSENGFVAHYYQMKASGKDVPPTLREFISVFSKAVLHPKATPQETTRAIMADVQPLLSEYGVQYDDISNVPPTFRDDVEKTYTFKLNEMHRTKPQILIDHDVQVLSHARRARSQDSQIRMCLTWDAVMIAVGRELEDCGWIVSPHEAADIIQARLKISGTKLTALTHSLARARERPSEIGARIIDRIVQLAGEQLQDWQFRKKVETFYREALDRIDLSSETYNQVDSEIERFLRVEGITAVSSDVDAGE